MRAKFIRGQEPKAAMGIGLATEIAKQTSDAYSFDRYGIDEWTGIAHFLLSMDVSPEVTEWVLRSKHMRWAADHMPEFDEKVGLEGFEHYVKRDANDIQKNLADSDILNK